jgi:hypothetical protein
MAVAALALLAGSVTMSAPAGASGVGTYVLDDFGWWVDDLLFPDFQVTVDVTEKTSTSALYDYTFDVQAVSPGPLDMQLIAFGFAVTPAVANPGGAVAITTPQGWIVDPNGSSFGDFGTSQITVKDNPLVPPPVWTDHVAFDLTLQQELALVPLESSAEYDYLFAAKVRVGEEILICAKKLFIGWQDTIGGGTYDPGGGGGNPSDVPLPAAFWLFGPALVGFVGLSRRRAAST